jgi:hypothetical protein
MVGSVHALNPDSGAPQKAAICKWADSSPAAEGEIASWREFRRSLRSIGSRDELDGMFD